jgi:hypothetical protein
MAGFLAPTNVRFLERCETAFAPANIDQFSMAAYPSRFLP